MPARSYDEVKCVPCWKDINPRLAASYDVFGNGKTALKVNVGRFAAADIYTMVRANNPVTRAVLTATRTWTDTNGNFAPDCNLANPAAQDLTLVGGDICGALNNRNFGLNNPNAAIYDPRVLLGYGARSYNWQKSVQVQHQSRHNIALSAGYYASFVFRNGDIAPSLDRNLSAGANGTVTVDLIPPQTQFEDRIQQLDLRFARTFRISGRRVEPEFDIYNALNALSVINSYSGAWRTPTQILSGRLLKFGLKVSF